MLDQFCAIDVSHENWRHERFINLFHQIDRMLILRADHNTVRMHQVSDGAALTQKFWVTYDIKFGAVTVISLDRFRHFFSRLYGHGTLINDYSVAFKNTGDFT